MIPQPKARATARTQAGSTQPSVFALAAMWAAAPQPMYTKSNIATNSATQASILTTLQLGCWTSAVPLEAARADL